MLIQPVDMGIIKVLKDNYKRKHSDFVISHLDKNKLPSFE